MTSNSNEPTGVLKIAKLLSYQPGECEMISRTNTNIFVTKIGTKLQSQSAWETAKLQKLTTAYNSNTPMTSWLGHGNEDDIISNPQ